MPGAVACMSVAEGRRYSEIWTMYVLMKVKDKSKKIKVITAWRYPGKSPERDPIPPDILREIRAVLI